MRPSADDCVFVDFETPTAPTYNLRDLGPLQYVMDPRFRVLCLGIAVGLGPISCYRLNGPPSGDVTDGIQLVRTELASGKWLVCHNAGFDALILKLRFGVEPSRVFDTRDYANALRIGASLENLALHLGLRKFDSPPFDESSLRDPRSLARLAKYNAQDVRITRAAFLAAVNDPKFPDEEFDVVDLTARQNLAGILLNPNRLMAVRSELEGVAASLVPALRVFPDFDPEKFNSYRYVGEYLEHKHGARPASFKRKGDDLPAYLRQYPAAVPFITQWQTARAVEAAANGLAARSGGRIYSQLRYHAAHTGRFTAGGDACDNFNIQALPKASRVLHPSIGLVRTIVTPDEGAFFVAADLSAIEARVIATLAGEEMMLEQFRNGGDLYVWLARQMFPGMPVAKNGPNEHLRELCKAAVLGIGFGMGFDTFQRGIIRVMPETPSEHIQLVYSQFKEMTPRLAQLRRETWTAFGRALSTGEPQHAARCVFLAVEGGADHGPTMLVELPSGRFLYFRDIWTKDGATRSGRPVAEYWYADGREYDATTRHGKKGPKSRLFPDDRYRDPVYETVVIENIVQGCARDIFVHQMLDLDRSREVRPAFHVHDEHVCTCRPCTCDFSGWKPPAEHEQGCQWAGAAARLVELMSKVPGTLPALADVPVSAELSKDVGRSYGG